MILKDPENNDIFFVGCGDPDNLECIGKVIFLWPDLVEFVKNLYLIWSLSPGLHGDPTDGRRPQQYRQDSTPLRRPRPVSRLSNSQAECDQILLFMKSGGICMNSSD